MAGQQQLSHTAQRIPCSCAQQYSLCTAVADLQNIKYNVRTDTLPDGSIIPAGSQLLYSPYVINRSRSFWGADAEQFRYAADAG
jgi:hypothetical protein